MSHHQDDHGAHTIHSKGGGGGGKWLIGALAAAVVLGGGYYAYKSLSSQPNQTEVALNDSAFDDSSSSQMAGPLPPLDDSSTQSSASLVEEDTTPAPAATTAPRRTTTASTTTRRTQTAARTPEPVPETVVGITPASVTMNEDEVVVQGRRPPVWTRTPTARRLSAVYPDRALERGLEGDVRLACTVQGDGALACTPTSETRRGFSTAAMRVSRMFRHSATRADGSSSVGSPVNLLVMFRMAEENGRG